MPDEQLAELALLVGFDPRVQIGLYRWERMKKKRAGVFAGIAGAACFLAALTTAAPNTATASPRPEPWSQLTAHYRQYGRMRRISATVRHLFAAILPKRALLGF